MSDIVEIKEIMKMIPHRYPFLMIDRVVDVVKGASAIGLKNVTMNEPYFQGHFPGHPVMPGVLIVEAMAQTAAVLVVKTQEDAAGKVVYFTSIDGAKFRKPVFPGDQLHIKVTVLQNRGPVWKFSCVAEVGGKKVTEGTITAMIMDEKAGNA